jgi:hypothetical protein
VINRTIFAASVAAVAFSVLAGSALGATASGTSPASDGGQVVCAYAYYDYIAGPFSNEVPGGSVDGGLSDSGDGVDLGGTIVDGGLNQTGGIVVLPGQTVPVSSSGYDPCCAPSQQEERTAPVGAWAGASCASPASTPAAVPEN